MEYVYAALLLHKLKQDINEDNVKNVIKATGVAPDDVRVKSLVAAISEVNIEDALKAAPIAAAPSAALLLHPHRQMQELLLLTKKRRKRRRKRKKKPWKVCLRCSANFFHFIVLLTNLSQSSAKIKLFLVIFPFYIFE